MKTTVWITGCDHGLGQALCNGFLNKGFRVIAGIYRPEGPEELAPSWTSKARGELFEIPLDVADSQSVIRAVDTVRNESPSLDLIVNNAGILGNIDQNIDGQLDFDEMDAVFRVNALGPLRMVHACLPLLRKGTRKGVVNISSEAGSIGDNFRDAWFGYCMSKAALNRQAALVYEGLKDEGFSVLCLHPGHVRSYMRGEVDTMASLTPEESAAALIPLILNPPKRFGFFDHTGIELPW